MRSIAVEVKQLPPEAINRWRPYMRSLALCFERGLVVEVRDDLLIEFPDWRQAIFGGRIATYLRFEKRLYLTRRAFNEGVYDDYAPGYRPDLHELAHAWRFLLVGARAFFGDYYPAWRKDRDDGVMHWYAGSSVEEGWAEDCEGLLRPVHRPILTGRRIPIVRRILSTFEIDMGVER